MTRPTHLGILHGRIRKGPTSQDGDFLVVSDREGFLDGSSNDWFLPVRLFERIDLLPEDGVDTRPRVNGYCPACGRLGLVLGREGDVECSYPLCEGWGAMAAIMTDPEIHHVVDFDQFDFTIRHPLIESLDDRLFDCPLHAHLMSLSSPAEEPGRYRAQTTMGVWVFEEVPPIPPGIIERQP